MTLISVWIIQCKCLTTRQRRKTVHCKTILWVMQPIKHNKWKNNTIPIERISVKNKNSWEDECSFFDVTQNPFRWQYIITVYFTGFNICGKTITAGSALTPCWFHIRCQVHIVKSRYTGNTNSGLMSSTNYFFIIIIWGEVTQKSTK